MEQYNIWDYYQNDEAMRKIAFTARARHQFLARQIPSGAQVLNIGVGDGGLERILVAKGVRVSALDPSEKTIAWLGQELHLGDRARVGVSQSIPFHDDEFDVVIMTEVLEHLSDEVTRQTIKEIRRVLKPGGRFLGTVPADENLTTNEVVCPHCGTKFHRWGHLQSFSTARLTSLLAGELSSVTVSRHFLCDFKKLNWKGRLYWIGKQLLLKAGIHGAGENLFFSAIKA
ncbi:MAG TPA: class I SAM-dependent methyltransferase [Chthonomonadales bacterium]|nr:class I SAM-dependent methyltransferase [Chthonomonadales bacterium]